MSGKEAKKEGNQVAPSLLTNTSIETGKELLPNHTTFDDGPRYHVDGSHQAEPA